MPVVRITENNYAVFCQDNIWFPDELLVILRYRTPLCHSAFRNASSILVSLHFIACIFFRRCSGVKSSMSFHSVLFFLCFFYIIVDNIFRKPDIRNPKLTPIPSFAPSHLVHRENNFIFKRGSQTPIIRRQQCTSSFATSLLRRTIRTP